jgi:hypothetical protein
MARRRKSVQHRKTTHRRRRRVSGIKDVNAMEIAYIIGGALVARIATNKLTASTNPTMQKLAPYVGIIAGVALPMVSKSPALKGIGLGMVGAGAISAFGPTGLKVISGMEASVGYPYNVLPYRKVAGVIQDGEYVSKANFSGSGQRQASVIGSIAQMAGSMS